MTKHKVLAVTLAFMVFVMMVSWFTTAAASSRAQSNARELANETTSTLSGGLAPHMVTVNPSCTTVATALVARALGSSMVMNGPMPSSGVLSYFNKVIRIKGKVVRASWIDCNYRHDPRNPGSLGVDITYIVEPTSAQATDIARSLCAVMRAISPDYTSQRIGSAACVQGHTGPMQSANGVVADTKVVIELFGSQSPAQTITLARVITPVIAKAKWGTSQSAPPVLLVTSNQLVIENGVIALGLNCKWGACTGTATLTLPTSSGSNVLAHANYSLSKGELLTVDLALTDYGSAYFGNPANSPTQAQLTITLKGAKTISSQVSVATFTPATTMVTTTT